MTRTTQKLSLRTFLFLLKNKEFVKDKKEHEQKSTHSNIGGADSFLFIRTTTYNIRQYFKAGFPMVGKARLVLRPQKYAPRITQYTP